MLHSNRKKDYKLNIAGYYIVFRDVMGIAEMRIIYRVCKISTNLRDF
jgi:hypothetical protein